MPSPTSKPQRAALAPPFKPQAPRPALILHGMGEVRSYTLGREQANQALHKPTKLSAPYLGRVAGHMDRWNESCRGGSTPPGLLSSFDSGGPTGTGILTKPPHICTLRRPGSTILLYIFASPEAPDFVPLRRHHSPRSRRTLFFLDDHMPPHERASQPRRAGNHTAYSIVNIRP